jgi:hypothetical protein
LSSEAVGKICTTMKGITKVAKKEQRSADGSILLPLKQKYLERKPKGFASKSGNSAPKKKTMAKMLQASARKRGK